MTGDWLNPAWLRDAIGGWKPPTLPAGAPEPVAAGMRQVADLFGFAPAGVARDVIEAANTRLAGREVRLLFGDLHVTSTVRTIRLQRPPLGLMIGQLGDVEIVVEDVRWAGRRIAWLRIDARNVHIQPGNPAMVVTAPVYVEAKVDQATVDEVVALTAPRTHVELLDGAARATIKGRPQWGWIDLVPHCEGDVLALRPATIAMWGTAVPDAILRHLPVLRFPLPEALAVGHVSSVAVERGAVRVRGVLDEWREPLGARQLDQVVRRITTFAGPELVLPRTSS